MKLFIDNLNYIDLSKPIDISIPIIDNERNLSAWYVSPPVFEPVKTENYTGSVKEGGPVNFRNIFFNPHGHGTHTECLGHITENVYSINKVLKTFHFKAQLISVSPKEVENKEGVIDEVIFPEDLGEISNSVEALIVRTLPNDESKKFKQYSSTNPPYFDVSCVEILLEKGIKHLLIDLPSVDREEDNGKLLFHHAFWEVPRQPNFERTITELIYVENNIPDGEYILNLQTAPFENDASPSKPVLYQIFKK